MVYYSFVFKFLAVCVFFFAFLDFFLCVVFFKKNSKDSKVFKRLKTIQKNQKFKKVSFADLVDHGF